MSNPTSDRWQLPDGVDELLPEAAWQVEQIRRQVMDCCHRSGYNLVMPPIIEYLDSLLTGTGETMNLQTFKLVDQHNGRTLGVRADMTPQVARMDAHALRSDQPNRFFYVGSVLRARTDGFGSSRAPLQFGAEIFGHAGPESDIEIVRLMLDSLSEAGQQPRDVLLDVGHVGVYRGLVQSLELDVEQERALFDGVQRGSVPDVLDWASGVDASVDQQKIMSMLTQLMTLNGDGSIVSSAKQILSDASEEVQNALQNLDDLLMGVRATHPDVQFNIDLAELRGYQYHTGVLFAAYTLEGIELARGGRYDAVGAAFGHARPATGFSGDLKTLAKARTEAGSNVQESTKQTAHGVLVDASLVASAWSEITRLKKAGERVVVELPNVMQRADHVLCDRRLVSIGGEWQLQPVHAEKQNSLS